MTSPPLVGPQERLTRRLSALTLALYVAFIVYQTLADGGRWQCGGPILAAGRLSRSDLLANVVAYVPIGLLAVLAWPAASWRSRRSWSAALVAATGAAGLSCALEIIQSCQAGRVSSIYDWVANAAGGMIGVIAALALAAPHRWWPGASVRGRVPVAAERERRLRLLTGAVAAGWVVSQTVPWVFAVDVGTIRGNLSFLRRWDGVSALDGWQTLRHAGAWLAIASACRLLSADRLRALGVLAATSAASLTLQVLLDASQPLSFEELIGMTAALAIGLAWISRTAGRGRRGSGVMLAGGAWLAIAAYELRPDLSAAVRGFSWWPRVGLGGLRGAIDYALLFGWFGMAVVVAAEWTAARSRGASRRWPVLAIASMLGFELLQTMIPGRGPDVSAPLFTGLAVLSALAILGVPAGPGGDAPRR